MPTQYSTSKIQSGYKGSDTGTGNSLVGRACNIFNPFVVSQIVFVAFVHFGAVIDIINCVVV